MSSRYDSNSFSSAQTLLFHQAKSLTHSSLSMEETPTSITRSIGLWTSLRWVVYVYLDRVFWSNLWHKCSKTCLDVLSLLLAIAQLFVKYYIRRKYILKFSFKYLQCHVLVFYCREPTCCRPWRTRLATAWVCSTPIRMSQWWRPSTGQRVRRYKTQSIKR